MIEVAEDPFKDTSDLCLPLIKLRELGERDVRRRREQIRARLADEERIRQEKQLKRLEELAEKQENAKIVSEKNFVWGRHWDREFASVRTIKLPPLSTEYCSFPLTKPYLTLFDTSSYRSEHQERPLRKRDLLLRFNTAATVVEVASDFHQIADCGLYRRQLQNQIRLKNEMIAEEKSRHRKLDELMHQNYPFGKADHRERQNYQDRFPRVRAPVELGTLDERFFPWCTTFGKTTTKKRPPKTGETFEPIICKTKTGHVKM